jgi:spermidine synthase
MMAHLPLGIVREPRSALVICFGMGTTYRSLMSWDVQVTAVELVPGVKDVFPYFFSDAAELLRRPNGKVVIDDGRRFLQRSGETYEVITLDPPPPVEAAASSLLYSEEFYATAKARLRPGGVLQQWVPTADPCTTEAVARSLLRSFTFVRMFSSYEGWGHHFLASMQPIEIPPAAALAQRLPANAKADLVEWTQSTDPAQPLAIVLQQERDPRELTKCGDARITDDRPYNEYYVLRSAWSAAASLFASAHADGRTARK